MLDILDSVRRILRIVSKHIDFILAIVFIYKYYKVYGILTQHLFFENFIFAIQFNVKYVYLMHIKFSIILIRLISLFTDNKCFLYKFRNVHNFN